MRGAAGAFPGGLVAPAPRDLLLARGRRPRVALAPLSITTLTDPFVAALETSAGRVPLEQRSVWLMLAAELVRVKSQLLAPAWLAARPQLGRDVPARGHKPR
ncbi:hypothetical protein QMO56_23240 [Roseomonas sp. E05]|uniref:hypothetical protein n=1 Tax=Roseomonas sp. E05 TaxID=3046310 RepID=UPI0024B8A4BC|nr:hypothetical protein [Roseomonas sp. E05]MDJ0391033.1 hypothetical protein [Roseomonas sp. E05]